MGFRAHNEGELERRPHMSLAKDSIPTVTVPAPALVTRWDVDPSHAIAQFGVRHMMISTVRGAFEKLSGHVTLDETDLTRSTVELTIDAASVSSREPKRDAHLRSADFFDVENHPHITFRSTRIEAAGRDQYRVTGDLTIRGVAKSTTLLVTGPTAGSRPRVASTARTGASTGTPSSRPAGSSSATRSS